MDVVIALLRDEFPTAAIREQPRNNPGYDVLITGAPISFVEVKGTTSSEVAFFMSDGERCFSEKHSDQYRLYVVFGIDLVHGTHRVFCHSGPVDLALFDIVPVQYRIAIADRSG